MFFMKRSLVIRMKCVRKDKEESLGMRILATCIVGLVFIVNGIMLGSLLVGAYFYVLDKSHVTSLVQWIVIASVGLAVLDMILDIVQRNKKTK